LPLKIKQKKYIQNKSVIDKNERINILHRPWIASLNWGIILYRGADKIWIKEAEEAMGKIIPEFLNDELISAEKKC
jgi:hypothetical protein